MKTDSLIQECELALLSNNKAQFSNLAEQLNQQSELSFRERYFRACFDDNYQTDFQALLDLSFNNLSTHQESELSVIQGRIVRAGLTGHPNLKQADVHFSTAFNLRNRSVFLDLAQTRLAKYQHDQAPNICIQELHHIKRHAKVASKSGYYSADYFIAMKANLLLARLHIKLARFELAIQTLNESATLLKALPSTLNRTHIDSDIRFLEEEIQTVSEQQTLAALAYEAEEQYFTSPQSLPTTLDLNAKTILHGYYQALNYNDQLKTEQSEEKSNVAVFWKNITTLTATKTSDTGLLCYTQALVYHFNPNEALAHLTQEKRWEKAEGLYLKAASLGINKAWKMLGLIYYYQENLSQAYDAFQMGAHAGNAECASRLYNHHLNDTIRQLLQEQKMGEAVNVLMEAKMLLENNQSHSSIAPLYNSICSRLNTNTVLPSLLSYNYFHEHYVAMLTTLEENNAFKKLKNKLSYLTNFSHLERNISLYNDLLENKNYEKAFECINAISQICNAILAIHFQKTFDQPWLETLANQVAYATYYVSDLAYQDQLKQKLSELRQTNLSEKLRFFTPKKNVISPLMKYKIEELDPQHRTWMSSELGNELFYQWLHTSDTGNFFEWLQENNINTDSITRIIYFSEKERTAFECKGINNTLCYCSTANTVLDGDYIFVISETGSVYLAKEQQHRSLTQEGVIHHTSFLSGARVRFAGQLTIESGQVTHLDNGSGHYQPEPDLIVRAIAKFTTLGVLAKQARVTTYGSDDDAMHSISIGEFTEQLSNKPTRSI